MKKRRRFPSNNGIPDINAEVIRLRAQLERAEAKIKKLRARLS
jgi:hypothetical protein